MSERTLDQYLADLKTVKDLLSRHDETSMLKPWAFFVWGAVVAVGIAVQATLPAVPIAVVWVPVGLAGGAAEIVAWLRRVKSAQTPLFGRRFARFVLSAIGVFAAIVPIGLTLFQAGLLSPGLILLVTSIVFLVYAQITYSSLFFEAYLVLAAGVIARLAGLDGRWAYIAAGILLAAAFVAFGVHSILLERQRRGEGAGG